MTDTASHRVTKTRVTKLLPDTALATKLQDAVRRVHKARQVASQFGKHLYLHRFDVVLRDSGNIFSREVATALADEFPLHAKQVGIWFDAVTYDAFGRQHGGRPRSDDQAVKFEEQWFFYHTLRCADILPTCPSLERLSYVKAAAVEQLVRNYRTNVHCHFDKYVRQYVRLELTPNEDLTPVRQRQLKTDIRAVVRDILEHGHPLKCRPQLHGLVNHWIDTLTPSPPSGHHRHWRFEDQKTRPERWLPFMVFMNRRFEELLGSSKLRAKLLSPLPIVSSFVPGHITISTKALVDMMIDSEADLKSRVLDNLTQMPVRASWCTPVASDPSSSTAPTWEFPRPVIDENNTPRPLGKGEFFNNLTSLVSDANRAIIDRTPDTQRLASAFFDTDVWSSLTNLGNDGGIPTTHLDLVFNNIIDTDGFSVSVHYVKRNLFGQTLYNGGFCAIKTAQREQQSAQRDAGAQYVTHMSQEERDAVLKGDGIDLSCDPGKGVLVTITDGHDVVRLTARQRSVESGAVEHRKQMQDLLRTWRDSRTEQTAQSLQEHIGAVPGARYGRSVKSCDTYHFIHYTATRTEVTEALDEFWSKTIFRRNRYRAYVGRRSCMDRFVRRIKAKWPMVKIMLYGDWGRRPNLRHQPPSPGVGLRRQLASYFNIKLVHEAYTSSRCPTCGHGDLSHPRHRPKRNKRTQVVEMQDIHHLLKCSNPQCPSPWWHRDVLGALNIMKTGMHALRHGTWHPVFQLHDDDD